MIVPLGLRHIYQKAPRSNPDAGFLEKAQLKAYNGRSTTRRMVRAFGMSPLPRTYKPLDERVGRSRFHYGGFDYLKAVNSMQETIIPALTAESK